MKSKSVIETIILCVLAFLVIFNSEKSKAGAINAIGLCRDIIIPSLLPIIIISNSITISKCSLVIEKLFGSLISKIFHLPKSAATPIILGAIGGYPTGAILTKELYESGCIEQEDAKRIMRFNINPGIAFTITAIGSVYLKSIKLGFIIYLICTISSFIAGAVEGIFYKNKKYYYKADTQRLDLSYAVVRSVEIATKSILIMCVYIILFSAILNIFGIKKEYIPLFEITSGIFGYGKAIPLEYLCFFLSFSGICIHLQINAITRAFDMKYYDLFLSRVIAASISYFLGKIYTLLCPQEAEVFSNISNAIPKASSVNSALSIVLLLGCIIIILDLKNKKSKLI